MSDLVPRLIRVQSSVHRCNCCHAWAFRTPQFVDGVGGWECERCGCTSTTFAPGRPYGPKSKEWERIKEEFAFWWNTSDGLHQETRDDMLIGCEYEAQS